MLNHLQQLYLFCFHPINPVVYVGKLLLEARDKQLVQAELRVTILSDAIATAAAAAAAAAAGLTSIICAHLKPIRQIDAFPAHIQPHAKEQHAQRQVPAGKA
jgi:hypothetical protein